MAATAVRSGSRSSRPFTLLGGLLAAGSLIIFAMVGANLSGSRGAGGGGPTQAVVVAARTVPIRTQLQPSDLTVAHWAEGDAPSSAYGRISDVVGMVTAVQLSRGEPLTGNNVTRTTDLITGGQGSYLPIPEGFVALTLPYSELNGVSGYVQPNDYVEVVAQTTGQNGKPRVQTVFTNLHVIGVGTATEQMVANAANGPGARPTPGASYRSFNMITVVATQCDAEFLDWLQTNAVIKYTLASYHDYQPNDTHPDPACATVTSAKGVTADQVDARWPGLVADQAGSGGARG